MDKKAPTIIGYIFLYEVNMCLICVEYQKNKMTREEVKKALPEMIMFSKTDKDKKHYEKLSAVSDEEFELEVENYMKTTR